MSKLSPGTLVLGIFAVLFGLIGAYGAKQYLQDVPELAPAELPSRQVVPLAGADIPAGRTLTLGDIMLVRMTRDEIRERGLPSLFMTNPIQIIGRTLREPVKKGHAFVTTMLYPEGLGPSVAERLQRGYRAITIPLEENGAEVALISPGMLVDVVFRTAADVVQQMPETTVTLLERVEVLAIGRQISEGARAAFGAGRGQATPTVTLAVTAQQASALKVVQGHGTMSLVVRGPEDGDLASPSKPQTLASLLNLPTPAPPFTTEIYRGGRLTTHVFEDGRQKTTIVDTLEGVPIAAYTGRPTLAPVSRRTEKPTGEKEEKPCGCGGG